MKNDRFESRKAKRLRRLELRRLGLPECLDYVKPKRVMRKHPVPCAEYVNPRECAKRNTPWCVQCAKRILICDYDKKECDLDLSSLPRGCVPRGCVPECPRAHY